jgi:hypothetical protein
MFLFLSASRSNTTTTITTFAVEVDSVRDGAVFIRAVICVDHDVWAVENRRRSVQRFLSSP